MTDKQEHPIVLTAKRKRGFTVPLELRAKDQEGVVFEMMTTVGAKVAESIVAAWRDDKRDWAVNITVTMEEK